MTTTRKVGGKRMRTRLASVLIMSVGVLGGLSAIGASPSSAIGMSAQVPTAYTWSSGVTVPGASTGVSDSPDISGCTMGVSCSAMVSWRNASTNAVDDRTSTSSNLKGPWGPIGAVPSALTSAGPHWQTFYDTYGNYGPFVTWKGQNTNQGVWYSANAKGSWTPQKTLPGASTNLAPAAFFPYYYYVMFVTWVGTNGHIYYSYGSPGVASGGVDTFSWSTPATIPGAVTNATPGVAEIQSNVDLGRLYVFWKGKSDNKIWYSWTTDPYVDGNTWAANAALTNGSPRTSAGPTAYNEGVTTDGVGNIMVAYKGIGTGIWYESMSSTFKWGSQFKVPGATTTAGPSLSDGLLAATTATGKITARTF